MLPADNDQRLKLLVREFPAELVALGHPEWAGRLDLGRPEWLDKEVFLDPPTGKRRALDLVAKVRMRNGGDVLLHCEIEGFASVEQMRRRMYEYHGPLRRDHDLPVLPLVVFLHVGLEGAGSEAYEEHVGPLRTLRFEFLYLGLPALRAETWGDRSNPVFWALSGFMKIARAKRAAFAAEGLKRIIDMPLDDRRKFIVAECLQAYMPMDDSQRAELDRILTTDDYRGVYVMATTWFEKGVEQGISQGVAQGISQGMERGVRQGGDAARRGVLLMLVEQRFGPASEVVRRKLAAMPDGEVESALGRFLKAGSLQELGLADA